MEKSIKHIWDSCNAAGWVQSEKMKLDFASQKSRSLVDKFNKRLKIDYWSIVPVSLLGLTYVIYKGDTAAIIYFLFLIAIMIFVNKRNMRVIENVEVNLDTYTYVVSFYTTIRRLIRHLTLFMVCIFPLVITPFYYLLVRNEDWFFELIAELRMPVLFLCIAFVLLMSVVGLVAYRVAVYLVYGRLLKRLQLIITDMELLRSH